MAFDELQIAILAVLTTFVLTIIWDRVKKWQEEREGRRGMLTAIHKELQTNLAFLSELDKKETYAAGQMFLWTDAYQSTISSDKIVTLNPKIQTQLAMVYLQLKQLETYGGKVLAMLGGDCDTGIQGGI